MLNQRVISFKRQFFTRWHTACSALWLSVVKRIWWIELSWCPKSKIKAIFLAIQSKGKYYNQPMITQTKKNKPPQVRDNAKARVKIEIMQFFRLLFSMVMTGWPWELRRIYIYIYIAQVVITSSVNQNISIGLMIYFVWSKNAREQEFRLSCYTRYNHIQISSFLCTLYPVRG